MEFGNRLRELRLAMEFSQQALAEKAGMTSRTIQNYELGKHPPKNIRQVKNLAAALAIPVNELLYEDEIIAFDSEEKGIEKAARDMKILVSKVIALFTGGDLDESDRDDAMKAISDAYWTAKEENKKQKPKKHRK